MSGSIEPTEDRRRWGGLSDDPSKAARQLAGLARNNRVLAARLSENLPGSAGKTPEDPGELPGSSAQPGEMPGTSGEPPGKRKLPGISPGSPGSLPGKIEAPGNLPGGHRDEPGKNGSPGDTGAAERASSSSGRVVPGHYRLDRAGVADPEDDDSGRPSAPYQLTRFEQAYARVLGFPREALGPEVDKVGEEGESARQPLSRLERTYARVLGYDV
jgi:hypothetical protein